VVADVGGAGEADWGYRTGLVGLAALSLTPTATSATRTRRVAGHRRVEWMPFTLYCACRSGPAGAQDAAATDRHGRQPAARGSDRGVEPSAGQPVVSGTARTAWAGRAGRRGEGVVTTKGVRS
jgi:hypothetical protein